MGGEAVSKNELKDLVDKLEEMKADNAIRKIYFNFDNTKIKRVK